MKKVVDQEKIEALKKWFVSIFGVQLHLSEAVQNWYTQGDKIISEIDDSDEHMQ